MGSAMPVCCFPARGFALVCAAVLFLPGVARSAEPAPAPANQPAAPADDPVVARVNGVELHRSDILALQRGLTPQAQKLPFDQVYPMLLDRLVDAELLTEAGRKDNLAQDPEVKGELARLEDRLIQRVYVERLLAAGETEARLKARYEQLIKEKPPQEEVHARHILVATEQEALAIIAQLDKGADFAELAKKNSKDPGTDSGGGDLGYFTKDEMVPAFAEAAFALPVGSYTKKPVKTEFGWHIIKVEDRRTAKPPTFEQAHDQIVRLVAGEILTEKLKALRGAAKIETYGPDGKPPPPSK